MTLKELKQKHRDIINLDQDVERCHIEAGAMGKAFFYVSLTSGTKPKDDRKVLWAGHVLTIGLVRDPSGDYLEFLRLTSHGNPKRDLVNLDEFGPGGRAALFYSRPIPSWDCRHRESWDHWD